MGQITEAPWETGGCLVFSRAGNHGPHVVAVCNGDRRSRIDNWPKDEEACANAKAIAALPKLLAACKEIARFSGGSSPWTMQCAEIARAALAAAEAE